MKAADAAPRVLVIGLQGLGNLILSGPLLHGLDRAGARVSVLVHDRGAAGLMALYPFLDRVIVAAGRSRWSLWRALRGGWDAAVVAYPGGPRSALLTVAAAAPRRLGHLGRGRRTARWALTQAWDPDPALHDVDHNLQLLVRTCRELGLEPPAGAPRFGLALPVAERDWADHWLAADSTPGEVLVGLAPGCGRQQAFKRWPLERFLATARGLAERVPGFAPVWFIGPDEPELLEQLAALPPELRRRVVTGTPLARTLAVLGRCRRLVCNDSGLMHMAVALQVPCTAVFGPTNEVRTRPYGADSTVLTAPDLPCRPCYSSNVQGFRCTHADPFACLSGVSVAAVLAAVADRLAAPEAAGPEQR